MVRSRQWHRFPALRGRHFAHIDEVDPNRIGQLCGRPVARLAQHDRSEAQRKFGNPRRAAGSRRDVHGKPALFRQTVDEGEQTGRRGILALGLDAPVLAGPHDQIDVGGALGELLIDVAFPVRHNGDLRGLAQYLAGPRRALDPALGFFVRRRPPAPRLRPALAVPYLDMDKADERSAGGVHRQHRMQQKPSHRAALADRAEPVGTRPPPPQCQLAGVLDRHHLAAGDAARRGRAGGHRHLAGRHRSIAQKAAELDLPRPSAGQPPDARTRLRHQRCVQQGPPFCRRRSPNRPSPNSTPAIDPSRKITSPSTESVFSVVRNQHV